MVSPKKLALVIVDMQNRFLDAGGRSIIPNITKLISTFREHQHPIAFTQHHDDKPGNSKMLKEWWDSPILEMSDDWKIVEDLEKLIDDSRDIVITDKTRYDAFYNTSLKSELDGLNVDTVVITGCMTHLCCETTARSAFVQDFRVVFVSDANGTSSQKHQNATLTNLEDGFAHILKTDELIDLVQKGGMLRR